VGGGDDIGQLGSSSIQVPSSSVSTRAPTTFQRSTTTTTGLNAQPLPPPDDRPKLKKKHTFSFLSRKGTKLDPSQIPQPLEPSPITIEHPGVNWRFVYPGIQECIVDLGKALKSSKETPDYDGLTNCIPVHIPNPPLIKNPAAYAFADNYDMRYKGWALDVARMVNNAKATLSKAQANTLLAVSHALHYCDLDMGKRGLEDRMEKFDKLAGDFMHILFWAPARSSNREKLMLHPGSTFELISEYGPLLFTKIQITDF